MIVYMCKKKNGVKKENVFCLTRGEFCSHNARHFKSEVMNA